MNCAFYLALDRLPMSLVAASTCDVLLRPLAEVGEMMTNLRLDEVTSRQGVDCVPASLVNRLGIEAITSKAFKHQFAAIEIFRHDEAELPGALIDLGSMERTDSRIGCWIAFDADHFPISIGMAERFDLERDVHGFESFRAGRS